MQFHQTIIQEQRLKMNPQLIQSIKLMELPIAELREKIDEELERNPALELLEDKITVPLNEAVEYSVKSMQGNRAREQASQEHRRFIEGALTRPKTLQEHLLWQLQLEEADDELRAIAQTLIQNLNDDGFHTEEPESLFSSVPPRLEEALTLVRGIEPVGCCVKDYKESLKVQIDIATASSPFFDETEIDTAKVIEILLDNLELLEREKYPLLAKKTGLDEEDTRDICEFIKTLSPFPGRAFAPADTRFVIPDIKVIKETTDDSPEEFSIVLNDEAFPVLGVTKFYEKLTEAESGGAKDGEELSSAREFARENVRQARLFIDHLKKRNKTLIRVANAVLQFQRSFFLKGPKNLAPLTLKDIAKELDIHETTVSRAANGKYMQTEWGIFEIRYFFTNSISGAGSEGSMFSKESVKEIIKEIIEAENRLFSDQDICALLGQKGIALARRTVAKYRKELDMGSSYDRKIQGGRQ